MDFIKLAKERYSVRKFAAKKVEEEKVAQILEAGRCAPTAVNYQPQRILVIESGDSLAKLRECTPYHFNAPLALLVCYDRTASWKRSYDGCDMGVVDASIVAAQMMLEAASLGLGTTWVGHFDPAAVRTAFELPEYIEPVALLPTGYPHDSAKPSHLHEDRLRLDDTVFYNSFDGIAPGAKGAGAHD
ncbi:nitroreductase family protein [Cloacibacillus porcorum]|uniref:Nitroreductase n=1 Tax=Cloacibacillus porcorum TaxID=1197717 RepID=A0A1B2I6Y6_9BACT|nr:nitroreductase family protein [Cloacibacillus porcorum]ANZ45730.1 nitroreductase [Cloacibacillus porcorum]